MEDKLKKLKLSSRIGGKGSMRRKKIIKSNRFKHTIVKTQSDLNLENIISRVNSKISSINSDEDYESFFVSKNEILSDYLNGISKSDFKSKDNYKKFREDPLEYFESNFLIESKKLFNKDITVYKGMFVNDSSNYFIEMLRSIENILENKKYLEKKEQNIEEEKLNLRECYELFDLDYTSEVSKEELHNKYKEKSLLYHPDRHIEDRELYEEKFKNLGISYKYILKNI